MTRSANQDWAVFFALVMAGALVRVVFHDSFNLPNFSPVAAISLFAGYYFSSAGLGLLIAPTIMLLSDCYIGFYSLPLMGTVYGMLTLPVVAGKFLKNWLRLDHANRLAASGSFLGLVGSSLAASVAFFLVTNFVVWTEGRFYSLDFAGLTRCYVQALPFFRNTLLGDLFFSLVLFGTCALLTRSGWSRSHASHRQYATAGAGK